MTRDTGVALGLVGLAGLYWLGADQIKVSTLEGIVGAQAVPKGLAVGLGQDDVLPRCELAAVIEPHRAGDQERLTDGDGAVEKCLAGPDALEHAAVIA